MRDFSKLLNKYSKNPEILLSIIQIILVYYNLRVGASINSIKNTRIVEEELIPFLNNLKIFYIYRQEQPHTKKELKYLEKIPGIDLKKLHTKQTNLYISSKPIPKSFLKSSKSFGKFLGYKCASNNYAKEDIIKKGRLIYKIYETNYKVNVFTDVCTYEDKRSLMKALKYYVEMIKKSKDKLFRHGLTLKLEIFDEKTKVKTLIY